MTDNKDSTNGEYKKYIQQFVTDYPNWPRYVYAASLVPAAITFAFPKKLLKNNFSYQSGARLAISSIGFGALARLVYMSAVGELFTPKKFTEKDILDNKAFLLASMANISGFLVASPFGFVVSFASVGCEAAAIAFRAANVMFPSTPETN